jgi:S1-C subfamily serine protease
MQRRQPVVPETPPSLLKKIQKRLVTYYKRFPIVFLLAAVVLIAFLSILTYDLTRSASQHLTPDDIDAAVKQTLASMPPKPSYAAQAYQIIQPSIVQIRATGPKAGGKIEGSIGTGVIIDDDGKILTSLHIVQDAFEIKVIFADGTESEAFISMKQPETDLAVLKPSIVPDDMIVATITSSNTLSIGDEVIAVGNPFAILNSVTAGVISGLGRDYKSPDLGTTLKNLIQFDAAVNPGNSGGPLVNRYGEVVGIITALFNPTGTNVFIGIGFAVPIETASSAAGSPPY